MSIPVIIDCDPGHDDALAILLSAGTPSLDVLAITTVAGNQTLDNVTANASSVARLGGLSCPISRGASGPLARPAITADVHGLTGLDGPEPGDLPSPLPAISTPASELIADLVLSRPGEITLIALGPLTNVALALRTPGVKEATKGIYLMGGSVGSGNLTPSAEFNIYVDPEAAREVFRSGVEVVMVPLEVTHRALATDAVISQIEALDTRLSVALVKILRFFKAAYKADQGFDDPPIHDPCAVMALIHPEIFRFEKAVIDVETKGELTTGQTVVDRRGGPPKGCTTAYAVDIDVEAFWGRVLQALERIGEPEW